jgi:hypothetical protein
MSACSAPRRFFDIYDIDNVQQAPNVVCPLDHRFVEVCVPGSIVPVAVAPDRPCQVGIVVRNGQIWIDTADCPRGVPTRLVVTISGIRDGKQGDRFPAFDAATAQRNKAFWSQAYEA